MKKTLSLLLVLLTLALLFTGCKTYKDTNGADDYTLQTLTEADILRASGNTCIGKTSTGTNSRLSVKVNTLHGVDTLATFSRGTVTMDLSVSVTKGNARLVLCTDSEILHDFDLHADHQIFSFRVTEGDPVYLRMAGEDCGYSLEFTVD